MEHTVLIRDIALVLVIAMAVFLLTGCTAKPKQGSDPSKVEGTEVSAVSPDETGLQELIAAMERIPVATMGSSMHATTVALQAMDWCSKTTLSSFDISDAVTAHLAAKEGEAWELFASQLDLVNIYCEQLYNEDSRASTLLTIGVEKTDFSWTEDTIDKAVSLTSY